MTSQSRSWVSCASAHCVISCWFKFIYLFIHFCTVTAKTVYKLLVYRAMCKQLVCAVDTAITSSILRNAVFFRKLFISTTYFWSVCICLMKMTELRQWPSPTGGAQGVRAPQVKVQHITPRIDFDLLCIDLC